MASDSTLPNRRRRLTLGNLVSLIYLMAWVYLIIRYIGEPDQDRLIEIIMNALIIALFVGLGLNINAFQIRNQEGQYRSLSSRILYILSHTRNVLTFFIVPFCVASASGLIMTTEHGNLVMALFRTESYALIMAGGFLVFILLPALYILYRHGWK